MRAKGGYIYIVSNKNRTVLYIGVTSDLYQKNMAT
ncbi:MAG: GIY-YIG nuclease family protein [Gammaproteobacteria bacterium]